MKDFHFFLIALTGLTLLNANEANQEKTCHWMPVDKDSMPLNSYLMFGADYTYVMFKPTGEASFNGNMGGLQAKYSYAPPNAFYAGIELDWRQGSMHGSDGKRNLVDVNTAETLGYTWEGKSWLYNLYSGFGFRFLGHHLYPSSISSSTFSGSYFPPFVSGATSVKFKYYELYVPIGFTSEYNFISCFTLGLNFEWMPQAFTSVAINSLNGAYWNITQKFANFRVELPFIFNLTCRGNWKLVINPFYEHWQDGHSTATTSSKIPLGLPGNTYNFIGVNLNALLAF